MEIDEIKSAREDLDLMLNYSREPDMVFLTGKLDYASEDYVSALRHFNQLLEKDHLVLINKMDLAAGSQRNVGALRTAFHQLGVKSIPLSALTGEGLEELKVELEELFFG